VAGTVVDLPAIPDRSLDRSFFARPVDEVAAALLGCALLTDRGDGLTGGWIVETEAYFGADDPASHAARLRNGRVRSMFGPVGIAYVYRSYGIHAMLNAVAHPEGGVGAVLIRAVEPIWSPERMAERRGTTKRSALCAGPGNVCQALGIGLDDHGHDLTVGAGIWIAGGPAPQAILSSGRIGISRAAERQLRFFIAGSRYVSAHRNGLTEQVR
jgi:DNA-3-methyladenine glycosylase